jgi:hypothetical protein
MGRCEMNDGDVCVMVQYLRIMTFRCSSPDF